MRLLACLRRPRAVHRAPAAPTLFDWAADRDELEATDVDPEAPFAGPRPLRAPLGPTPGSRHVRLIPAEEATRARLRPDLRAE